MVSKFTLPAGFGARLRGPIDGHLRPEMFDVPTRAEVEVGYERQLGAAETFSVMELEVAVEDNATTFMRVALGASHRYVTGISSMGIARYLAGFPAS